jgi:hypothetical protein
MTNLPNLTPNEIVKNFAGFEKDIEEYKRTIKRLKRKKIDFKPEVFTIAIRHLQEKENEYSQLMAEMFVTEENKEELIAELSWLTYNRRGIQQKMFDYETEVLNN